MFYDDYYHPIHFPLHNVPCISCISVLITVLTITALNKLITINADTDSDPHSATLTHIIPYRHGKSKLSPGIWRERVLPKVRVCVSSPRLTTRDGTFRFCRLILLLDLSSSWSCTDDSVLRAAIGWHLRVILGLVQSEETFAGGSQQWLKGETTCFEIHIKCEYSWIQEPNRGKIDFSWFLWSKSLTFTLKSS